MVPRRLDLDSQLFLRYRVSPSHGTGSGVSDVHRLDNTVYVVGLFVPYTSRRTLSPGRVDRSGGTRGSTPLLSSLPDPTGVRPPN